MITGRFAPSPSGRMHLGNVYAAVMSWYYAKRRGGKWILRIENLDPGRSRQEYALMIEDDLHWLGLDWDEGGLDNKGTHGPYVQSQRYEYYAEALKKLKETATVYPCYCTRADIHAASAPHQSDGRIIYPGTCRPSHGISPEPDPKRRHSLRIAVPDENIRFHDTLCGWQSVNLARDCGDFILRRSDGAWAYQLAVVVDDAMMGVNQVVRGCDLLESSALQIYLYRLLGYPEPEFVHLPLIVNEKGERLSKRDASRGMDYLRAHHTPGTLLGMIACEANLQPEPAPLTPAEFLSLTAPSPAL